MMQEVEKIIDFESFREFCKYRNRHSCNNEDHITGTCIKPDRIARDSCPIWYMFKNSERRVSDGRYGKKRKKFCKRFREEEREIIAED